LALNNNHALAMLKYFCRERLLAIIDSFWYTMKDHLKAF